LAEEEEEIQQEQVPGQEVTKHPLQFTVKGILSVKVFISRTKKIN